MSLWIEDFLQCRRMEAIKDLIEEAKRRSLLVAICVVSLAYFMSLTSHSILINIPIAVLIVAVLRRLSFELHIQWKIPRLKLLSSLRAVHPHLASLLIGASSSSPAKMPQDCGRFQSHEIEIALDELTRSVIHEWVTNLWYSGLTPDQETPEEIRILINGVFEEVSRRIKRINLVTLIFQDLAEMLGRHLELYRRTQAFLGIETLENLSFEDRDSKLKVALEMTGELHPALVSEDNEYEVLKRIMGGVVAMVLRPQDGQCRVAHCLARELLACSVVRPIMNFATPRSINQLIGSFVEKTQSSEQAPAPAQTSKGVSESGIAVADGMPNKLSTSMPTDNSNRNSLKQAYTPIQDPSYLGGKQFKERAAPFGTAQENRSASRKLAVPNPGRSWTNVMEEVSQRKTQVLAPEHLDNLWTKGRNYKVKETSKPFSKPLEKEKENSSLSAMANCHSPSLSSVCLSKGNELASAITAEPVGQRPNANQWVENSNSIEMEKFASNGVSLDTQKDSVLVSHRRSWSSGAELEGWQDVDGGEGIPGLMKVGEGPGAVSKASGSFENQTKRSRDGLEKFTLAAKLWKGRLQGSVIGAQFAKSGSKVFTVYTICVTDPGGQKWDVQRRYRNFEQLHRQLKDKPDYSLHLPPKRFLSSSLDNSFVQERCTLLDKYLKDLLSICSIAELHNVWDFLSANSQDYACGDSVSMIKTLCMNTVGAVVDDLYCQVRADSDDVSDTVKVGSSEIREQLVLYGSSTASSASNVKCSTSLAGPQSTMQGLAWDKRTTAHHIMWEEDEIDEDFAEGLDWQVGPDSQPSHEQHTDCRIFGPESSRETGNFTDGKPFLEALSSVGSSESDVQEDDNMRVVQEWSPQLCGHLLNLVDLLFQLQDGGWARRQLLWLAKQVLELGMSDAIDDFLFDQIQLLQREDVVAGIVRWIQGALWPDGIFVTNHPRRQAHQSGSQMSGQDIESPSHSSVVREIMLEKPSPALVTLIGHSQYQSSMKDIYYFLQSAVCIKQLAYDLLELLVSGTFPELQDLLLDIRNL